MYKRYSIGEGGLFTQIVSGKRANVFFFLAALFFSLFLLGNIPALAQLSGTKTIGSGGNYATFSAAVADLNAQGVGAGGVTFNVKSGSYNEQVRIGNIAGVSASNPVIFQSQVGIKDSVTLYFAATGPSNNYVVKLDSADYVTFQNMTFQATGTSYAIIFYLLNGADNNSIKNNNLTGYSTGSSSGNYNLIYSYFTSEDNTEISGNSFSNGSWGVYIVGVNNATQSIGTRVLNNTFNTGYAGVYLQHHNSPVIRNNVITANGYSGYGIYAYDCDDSLRIQKNKVNLPTNGNGIIAQYCDGTQFGGRGLIANNFITVGGTGGAAGLQLDYCNYLNVYYNSVNQTNTHTSYYAFYLNSGGNISVRNNIFANNGGYAYYTNTPAAIANSNYNDLYTPGSYLAYWSGDRKDLAAFKTASNTDTNSIFIYPQYLSATDLHQSSPWIDSAGTPSSLVTDDIDGQLRDASKPDIGADEFVAAPSTLTPLSGTYTVGSGGNYATLNAAVSDVVLKGVSGPVIFDVMPGSYNERFLLVNVPGNSTTNTITFESQSGNAADVSIFKEALNASENYMVRLYGADNVTLQNLSFFATGTNYARVIELMGGVDNAKIMNNILSGYATGSSSAQYNLIACDNYNYPSYSYTSNIQITGNNFSQGGWSIIMYGLSTTVPTLGTRVLNNTFSSGYGGVYLNAHKSAYVNSNVITVTGNSGYGVYAYDCDDSLQIQKNRINLPTNGNGILTQYCDGTQFGGKGLIANNFVTVGGTGGAAGLQLDYCVYMNVYYNSVNQTNTHTSYYAFYVNSGGNISVRNNIFANNGGYAYYTNTPSAIATSNYNDLYTPGNFLAYWSGNRKDLAAFKTASSKDTNSVFIYPQYLSSTDLHQASPWIDSAAAPVSSVTQDIDGDARDASKPDIGADEFVAAPASLAPLTGTLTIGSLSKSTSPLANYATLTEAVNDLVLRGVGGPVIFDIQPGNFNERMDLVNVPGSSTTNTVTFQSQTGNRGDVIIYAEALSPGENYVVRLNGADHLIFKNLTFQAIGANYARDFYLWGGVDNLKIQNNLLIGAPTTSSSPNYYLIHGDYNYSSGTQITGNTFSQGGWGIVMYGLNTNDVATGTRVLNDTFSTGYGGVYLNAHKSAYINSNVITANGNSGNGIWAYDCDDSLQIQKNKVNLPTNGNGILLQYCDGTQLGVKGLTANNFVTIGGTGGASALGLDYCTYQNVYYNSINQTNTNTYYGAFYVNSGGNIKIKNNIFANNGGGYAYYTNTPASIDTSNYNDLYTPGNFLAYWTSNRKDLAALQLASGKDANSVFIYPQFISATDLHQASPWLDSMAAPIGGLGGVTQDIDGNARDASKPDIGADEFVAAPSSLTPLSGIYTIGSGGNYATLAGAVDEVVLKGVSGPVTFNFLAGTYNERVSIVSIPGASETNSVTFQSQSGNRNDVTIYKEALSPSENYIVRLYGADYITFQKLKFQAPGASYARIFDLVGGVDYAKIQNNLLIGYSTTSSSGNYTLINSDNYYITNTLITGNTFNQGGWGIVMYGLSNAVPTTGTRILNDTFSTGYGGVYLNTHKSAYVNGNVITANGNSGFGIYAYDCDDSLQIQKNKVNLPTNGNGILLQYCDGTDLGVKGLTANNFVRVGGTGGAAGIGLDFCNYQNIYYNSINQTNTHPSYYSFYANYGGSINVVDNIFKNQGGGYAYSTATPATIANSNYNDLYTTGASLAYWNGPLADLAAFKAASGKDFNSISIDPKFPNATNLHVGDTLLDSTGTPLAEVTDDIDGQLRDPNYPDIGADEFTCTAIPGDVNASGGITITDIIFLINYYFDKDKPPCLGSDPGNCWTPNPICRGEINGTGGTTLTDIIYLVNYYFDKDRLPCLGADPGNCWTPVATGTCCFPVP